MDALQRTVLRFVQIVGKLFVVRAFASGPITRRDEARLRALMAADPPISRRRPKLVTKIQNG